MSLLKQSLRFCLLGSPLCENKTLVFVIKAFPRLFLPYTADLGVDVAFLFVTQISSFLLPQRPFCREEPSVMESEFSHVSQWSPLLGPCELMKSKHVKKL